MLSIRRNRKMHALPRLAQYPDSEVRWIEKRSESGHELFVVSGLLIPYVRRENAERRGHDTGALSFVTGAGFFVCGASHQA